MTARPPFDSIGFYGYGLDDSDIEEFLSNEYPMELEVSNYQLLILKNIDLYTVESISSPPTPTPPPFSPPLFLSSPRALTHKHIHRKLLCTRLSSLLEYLDPRSSKPQVLGEVLPKDSIPATAPASSLLTAGM